MGKGSSSACALGVSEAICEASRISDNPWLSSRETEYSKLDSWNNII